ncbi:chromate transporter [Paenibacillus typhae]|uniref:Chromate transporter n=1 Tax=Paenibacillus typhae TaxID=1174501 RepID=A0A1G8FK58_9BACL|nr:chromate transporter [Paenibacillus typhae]SDH82495.1 chromate transporter [Paenibacillus typhae]
MKAWKKEDIKVLLQLFTLFFKLGPSTFGGGYAMIAAIEREIVNKKAWLKPGEIGDMVSVAGSAPGGVAVNSAAFVGYKLAGVLGAVVAVFAITLPTFLIVLILSILGMLFQDVPKVQAALKGVHAAVVALIIVAAYKIGRASIMDIPTLLIACISVLLLLFTPLHSIYLILGGPVAGVAIIAVKKVLGLSAQTEKQVKDQQADLNYLEYYI